MEDSTFKGDKDYHIDATGDVVVGDEVRFDRATFTGSFKNAKFAGYERVTAKVIKDSYGQDKQQHTFTLQFEDGTTSRIKGRNLYANGVWRKPWENEEDRVLAQEDTHLRGDVAREERRQRLFEEGKFDRLGTKYAEVADKAQSNEAVQEPDEPEPEMTM